MGRSCRQLCKLRPGSSRNVMTGRKLIAAYLEVLISRVLFWIPSLFLIAVTVPFGAQAQEQIISGYYGHAGFQGPVWAAKDLDLFDKYGLSAELVLIPGSARGMAALISGS